MQKCLADDRALVPLGRRHDLVKSHLAVVNKLMRRSACFVSQN